MKNDDKLLVVENITMEFPGVKALNEVSLKISGGVVTAIIGENGAGKSTLMKILSGVYQDYEGTIFFQDKPVKFKSTQDARDHGISIIHQELNLIPYLSICENIFLGREPLNSLGFLDFSSMRSESLKLLRRLKLDIDPDTKIYKLKVGQQQLVEIAKALSLDSRVIIMDEPTSAISENEVEVLFQIVDDLKKEGKAVIYISHKLDELFRIADNYVVLRDGEFVEAGAMKGITESALIHKMVGREIIIQRTKAKEIFKEKLLEVQDLSLRNPLMPDKHILNSISLSLFRGEVLGVFGLMGAGRTELLEALFGMHPSECSGEIKLNDLKQNLKSPAHAMKAGMALVPEDRKKDGLILSMDICRNSSITVLDKTSSSGFLNRNKEEGLAQKYITELRIKASSCRQVVEKLSGGNQQKVVLAKWLATEPKVLMLDEPTRGIDINAKNEIYKLIRDLAAKGLGLIFVSSELPEILTIADRVLVMAEGRITGNIEITEETSEGEILKAAIPNTIQQ